MIGRDVDAALARLRPSSPKPRTKADTTARLLEKAGWDWPGFKALPMGAWHDFHIWRERPAAEAIEMGQPFALRELLPVLTDLARGYLDVVVAAPLPR